MGDCDAAVTVAMAACRRCKQRIKNINQVALVLELLHVEDQSSPENTSSICSLCNLRRIQQSRPRCRLLVYVYRKTRTRLDLLRYCTDRSVCIVRCGLRASFVWLWKSETIEDHLLYHATVVRKCTSKAMSLLVAVLRDFCCG